MLLHIYPSRRNVYVITKISYLQPFREIMGGQNSVTTTPTTTPTTTTTNTTHDYNSPPGFFQNPRANNHSQLLSLYHFIFSSHMIYGCQTWDLSNNKYITKIQTPQNNALRLLSFSDSPTSPFHHTVDIYTKYKLLKFSDLIT